MIKSSSPILLIFYLPILFLKKTKKVLRKTKIDNFIGGLIIGAIFSLVVNIATIQIQEEVTKQRALEAIENEVLSNSLLANNTINEDNLGIKKGDMPQLFRTYRIYSKSVWDNPSTLQYIEQLDPAIQIKISGYYLITVDGYNNATNKITDYSKLKLDGCILPEKNLDTNSMNNCKQLNSTFLTMEKTSAYYVGNDGFKLLKVFHPTQDRLNSLMLRILMGNKAVKVLSG